MDFREIAAEVVRVAREYERRYGVVIDQDFAALKLAEEVGEFTQALLIARRQCRPDKVRPEDEALAAAAAELADVVGMAMVNAHLLGVDLQEALLAKWVRKEV